MAFNGTGSNVTSLNANNISSGTVPTARLGSGTADSSTYLRGDQTYAAIPASLPGLGGQVFTSSGTFTVPAGVTRVKVTVAGGGGNGGNSRANFQPSPRGGGVLTAAGGGGGGAGVAIKYVTGLTPGGTVSVTVGGAAGTSSFGAFVSATGGASAANANGTSGNPAASFTAGGAGGTGSGGDINITGGTGRNASPAGGAGSLAGGAVGPVVQSAGCCGVGEVIAVPAGILGGVPGLAVPRTAADLNGNAATGIGNGGSGAITGTNGQTRTGGAGSNGIVIVEF
jgi:hypothetical protein